MDNEQDKLRSGTEKIEVDALFAAQQPEERRQRSRVAAVLGAALAAGGLIGGVAVVEINGRDGGPATADDTDASAGASAEDAASTAEAPDAGATGDAAPSGTASPAAPADAVPSTPPEDTGGGGENGQVNETAGTGASPQTGSTEQAPAQHVVQPGESLWTITAGVLGEGASAQQILETWPEIYAANRDVIGDDPDVLRPGQQLVLPALT